LFRRKPLSWYPADGGFEASWYDGVRPQPQRFRLEPQLYLTPARRDAVTGPEVGWSVRWEDGDEYLVTWRTALHGGDSYESGIFTLVGAIRAAETFRYETERERWSRGWRRSLWWLVRRFAWNRHSAWLDRHWPEPRTSVIGRVPRAQQTAAQWELIIDSEAKARLVAQGAEPTQITE
jgi:hypothetical protein